MTEEPEDYKEPAMTEEPELQKHQTPTTADVVCSIISLLKQK